MAAVVALLGFFTAPVAGAQPSGATDVNTTFVDLLCITSGQHFLYNAEEDVWINTIGDTQHFHGTYTLVNPFNGHSHVFPVDGTRTGTDVDALVYTGRMMVQSAHAMVGIQFSSYLIGWGTTVGGPIFEEHGQITSHHGQLFNPCDFIV
jgi:hypothetical protein